MARPPLRLRSLRTEQLTEAEIAAIRLLLERAFGDDPEERFTDDDWWHAIGGLHVVADVDGEIVAHASVVPRTLHVGGRPIRTGYVEAVGTAPSRQRQGFGTMVMREVDAYIRATFALGALGTGIQPFYERLGWQTWRGPTSVRTADGEQRTPDDDGYVMVLRTDASPELDLDDPISCDWRPGDVW